MSGPSWDECRSQPIDFGKHYCERWRDVPDDYLEWLQAQHSPTAGIIRNRHASMAGMELELRKLTRRDARLPVVTIPGNTEIQRS